MFNSFPSRFPDSAGGGIKSVQRGTATVTSSGTNVPISPVNVNNCLLLLTTVNQASGSPNQGIARGTVTSSTNINLVLNSGTAPVRWQLIEFNSAKSRQTGQLSLPSTTGTTTVTISPINPSKSLIVASLTTSISTASGTAMELGYEITNSTTITFEHYGGSDNKVIEWQVIEFP